MSNTLENIRDIFAILHDGVITEVTGNKELLTLKVECQYLAQRIDPAFDLFFIDLTDINRLAFVPWMNPKELEQEYFADPAIIFKAPLDILSAEIEQDWVKITCNQSDPAYDYCGGTLYLLCGSIKAFDQNKNELSIDLLDKVCNEYWNDFGLRSSAT